jgi:uncharacterized membrane protein
MSDKITRSIIVKGNAPYIFSLWANFENFPLFMKNIKFVRKTGGQMSHWIMEGPMGKDLEWDAQITDFQENKRIAWNSTSGDIKTSGAVTFNELAQNETEIMATIFYVPPAGKLGDAVAHLFDNPEKKLEEDLKRFKKYAEKNVEIGAARR